MSRAGIPPIYSYMRNVDVAAQRNYVDPDMAETDVVVVVVPVATTSKADRNRLVRRSLAPKQRADCLHMMLRPRADNHEIRRRAHDREGASAAYVVVAGG